MYAITVRQPWAQAIAQFGKNVENRTRRPPAHLIGQRIAIHAGKTWGINETGIPLPQAMLEWTRERCRIGDNGRLAVPTHAGRIIATATLAGWVAPTGLEVTDHEIENDGEGSLSRGEVLKAWWANEDWRDTVRSAEHSPWITGPVGWVLADVVMLLEPVGQSQDCATCPNRNGYPPEPRGYCLCDAPIRGQLGCWKVAPDVVAQVHEQEQMARGRR